MRPVRRIRGSWPPDNQPSLGAANPLPLQHHICLPRSIWHAGLRPRSPDPSVPLLHLPKKEHSRMSENAVVETHVLDVSKEGFFRFLRETFTKSTTFLGELLQNGRRAGATHLAIEWDADQNVMTVSDDGCGISDFKPLFLACKSGWDPEVE